MVSSMGNFYMDLRHNDEKPIEKNPLRTRMITDVEERVLELEEQLNKLLIVNAALYDVIKEKLNVTDDDISRRITIFNDKNPLQDQQRIDQQVRKCRKCGKNLIQRRSICVYCGADNDK